MRYFSTFSGIGAFELAFDKLGWWCVGRSEVDPFACVVLNRHWPFTPNFGDISQIDPVDIPDCDLLCGGWPCQDHSIAGKREGINGSRSGLVRQAIRIVHYLRRERGLRWVVLENVPGLFSDDAGRAFASVVGALVGTAFDVPPGGWQNAGAATGPFGLAEWRVLDGQHFGPPQRRKRIFIVVDFGDWGSREPVLLVPDRMPGDSEACREAGTDVAGAFAQGFGSGGADDNAGQAGHLVASTLGASEGTGGLAGSFAVGDNLVASTLTAHTHQTDQDSPFSNHLATNAINARYGWKQSGRGDGTTPMIASGLTRNYGDKQDNGFGCMAMVSGSLTAREGKGPDSDCTTTLVTSIAENQRGELRESDVVNINGNGGKPGQGYAAVASDQWIRKLTPREVSRCFGFPDSHLEDVTWRGKCPPSDTARYRALGNSIVVPVLEWIGKRIEHAHRAHSAS